MAVFPTGFGKSIIYQSFVIAKNITNTTSIVVVVQLRSIIEDQLQSNDFNIKAVAFEKIPKLLKDIGANKYNVIFASAEQALSAEFTASKYDINNSFPVVLRHFLNYTSDVWVVDFFYAGPRRKIH